MGAVLTILEVLIIPVILHLNLAQPSLVNSIPLAAGFVFFLLQHTSAGSVQSRPHIALALALATSADAEKRDARSVVPHGVVEALLDNWLEDHRVILVSFRCHLHVLVIKAESYVYPVFEANFKLTVECLVHGVTSAPDVEAHLCHTLLVKDVIDILVPTETD